MPTIHHPHAFQVLNEWLQEIKHKEIRAWMERNRELLLDEISTRIDSGQSIDRSNVLDTINKHI